MNTKNKIIIRLASILIDSIIIALLFLIVLLIMKFNPSLMEKLPFWLEVALFIFGYLLFSLIFTKDIIGGRSLSKRIFGLVIVNNKTGAIASPVKTVIRNITFPIYIIELIFLFFSPERRIGDFIAGTKVVSNSEELISKNNVKQMFFGLVLALVFVLILFGMITIIQNAN